jgi:RNA polymerase sigma-70 factor (ECF subfamily)
VETDSALIERSVRGRPDAFVEVVRRHETAVHKFLARRAGHDAAGDLLGEVWVRAFGARHTFRTEYGNCLPWLYGIARNVLRAHWRTEGNGSENEPREETVDPWDEVVERLDSAAWARQLTAALRELAPACREVLLLVAWEDLSPAEAADVLGIPQGTARSRLHRARSELRIALARQANRDDGEEDTCQHSQTTPAKTR